MKRARTSDDEAPPRDGLAATMLAHDSLVDTLALPSRASRRSTGAAKRVAVGAVIGRYVVISELGAGGMGVVYAAYDPELDRKVALKVLRPELAGGRRGDLDDARARLIREAHALAKLAHPNVVAIHDVGEHEGGVWLAMEHVDGVTLDAWLAAAPRSLADVLEVMAAAGRGLAAAHAAELLHRDFKPDNVMVGRDGRTRVMDLGLARAERRPSVEVAADEEATPLSTSTSDLQVTRAGALVGTPAYMSPELFRGREPDARADVFAYCVTLYEALYGERPFAGDSLAVLAANVLAGALRPPPRRGRRRVPRWLHQVCVRGLAVDPDQRFPSMSALLEAIARGRARARRRWIAAAIGAVAIAGAVAGLERYDLARRTAACAAEGAAIDEVWDEAARARVRDGLLATGTRFAPASLETLTPWLDEYRDAWRAGRTEVCMHRSIERDWDDERLDRSTWCFEDRRLQLEATVEQLSTLSRASARRAVRIASYLDPVATCLDPNLLQRMPVPPPALRDATRAIRATLSESDRLRYEGRVAESLAAATAARERAEALGWSPLRSLARFIEGRSAEEAGQPERAEELLLQAYFEAQADGSSEVAFRAARSLMIVYTGMQRHRDAEVWSRHADVLASTLQDPSGLDAAEGHYLRSMIYVGLREYEAAATEGERAVALRTAALGPDHPITAAATRNLGEVYLEQGRALEAIELFEHADAIWEDAVGHEHPQVAGLAMLRGRALWQLGRADEALPLLRDGVAIYEKVFGADHPRTLRSVGELAEVLLALGQVDEAEPLLERMRASERGGATPR